MSATDDDWVVECSDEEVDAAFQENEQGMCFPTGVGDVVASCGAVARARAGEGMLSWSSKYGRRPTTPQAMSDSPSEDEQVVSSRVDTSGFDFSDDCQSLRLQPRRPPGGTPKGSAKKKTTNFETILASVRRQKKMEAREKSNRSKK